MIEKFLKMEASGGLVLVAASILALVAANSALATYYTTFLDLPVEIIIGSFEIAKPLLLWINDGLMAIFFFLVGLEIKREFVEGELSSASQLALPVLAALGGLIAPAAIYAFINMDSPTNLNGWAIPTATDIAFALGILALVGSRAPLALKVLLTAIAIFDDLGAIIIIALFYTSQLSLTALIGAVACAIGLFLLNRLKVAQPAAYLLLGLVLWVFTLKSGVHATLAGVFTALAIPIRREVEPAESMLHNLEHKLHPWIAFGVLPIFAFANAGVSFAGISPVSFIEPVKLGISMGLFAGKQVGVFLCLLLAIKLGISPMPKDTNWRQLYGVSLLCGVGFTMSLFIGSLAFEHSSFDAPIRLGVLTGSLISGVCGYLLLATMPQRESGH